MLLALAAAQYVARAFDFFTASAAKAGFLIDLIEAESLSPLEPPRMTAAVSKPYQILSSEFLQKDLKRGPNQVAAKMARKLGRKLAYLDRLQASEESRVDSTN